MGKILIVTGLILIVAGLLMSTLPVNGVPRLPGDIHIKRDNFTFYFPLGWSVAISIVASLVFWLAGKR